MFHYLIKGTDYSLAGEDEYIAYSGTNREEAAKAIRRCREWLGAYVCVELISDRAKKLKALRFFEPDFELPF